MTFIYFCEIILSGTRFKHFSNHVTFLFMNDIGFLPPREPMFRFYGVSKLPKEMVETPRAGHSPPLLSLALQVGLDWGWIHFHLFPGGVAAAKKGATLGELLVWETHISIWPRSSSVVEPMKNASEKWCFVPGEQTGTSHSKLFSYLCSKKLIPSQSIHDYLARYADRTKEGREA